MTQRTTLHGSLFSAAAVALLLVAGCSRSQTPRQDSGATPEAEAGGQPAATGATGEQSPDRRERELAEREAALAQREAELAARDGGSTPSRSSASGPEAASPAPAETAGEPAPASAEPAPQVVTLTVPAGTKLSIELLESLSSGTSTTGETFRARLASGVMAGGQAALPAGSVVYGTVTEAVPLKKFGGQPKLALTFDRIVLPSGATVALATPLLIEGKKQAGKDAAKIGGAAAAGAILGHQVDDDQGKAVGAIVGGAIGTAIAAKTGKDVEVPAGTVVEVALPRDVQVSVTR